LEVSVAERETSFHMVGVDHSPARSRGVSSLAGSVGAHAVLLGAVVILPIVRAESLPDPATSATKAFFVEPSLVAPPPPPPPPAPARAATAPRIETPKPPTAFQAPVEVPAAIAPEETLAAGLEGGVPGGVEGGVPGGVVGGVVGGIPEAPPPTVVRVGGTVKEPRKLKNVPPEYPTLALAGHVQGTVVLEATIGPDGRVAEVKVLRSVPLLDTAAVAAVKQWVYTPTLVSGVPVAAIMTVTVTFTLS
jgi:protein TonB